MNSKVPAKETFDDLAEVGIDHDPTGFALFATRDATTFRETREAERVQSSSIRINLLGVVFKAFANFATIRMVGDFNPRSIWLTYVR